MRSLSVPQVFLFFLLVCRQASTAPSEHAPTFVPDDPQGNLGIRRELRAMGSPLLQPSCTSNHCPSGIEDLPKLPFLFPATLLREIKSGLYRRHLLAALGAS